MVANHRILVVCEDPNMLDRIGKHLCEQCFDVQCASNAGEALCCYAEWAAELVISDYRLSDMHGLDLIRMVREKNERARFILIVPPGETPEFMRATRSRIVAYLGKPFQPEDLMYYVHGAIAVGDVSVNRRAHTRYCSAIETHCLLINPFDDTERPVAALTQDVSRSGITMIIRQVIPVPAVLKIIFNLSDQQICMLAKTISCTLTQMSGVYRLGVIFTSLLPAELEQIIAQLSRNGKSKPEGDLFMGKSFKHALLDWIAIHENEFPVHEGGLAQSILVDIPDDTR